MRKRIGALPSFDHDEKHGGGGGGGGGQARIPALGGVGLPASPDVQLEYTYQVPPSPFQGSPNQAQEDPKSIIGSPQYVVEEEGITEDWEKSAWKCPSVEEAQERRRQEIFSQGKASLWTKPEELALMGKKTIYSLDNIHNTHMITFFTSTCPINNKQDLASTFISFSCAPCAYSSWQLHYSIFHTFTYPSVAMLWPPTKSALQL